MPQDLPSTTLACTFWWTFAHLLLPWHSHAGATQQCAWQHGGISQAQQQLQLYLSLLP